MTIVLATANVTENPLFVAVVGVMLTAAIAVTGAVIGLFIKMSSVHTILEAMRTDLDQIAKDPDVMRWSAWAQRSPDPEGVANPRRRRKT